LLYQASRGAGKMIGIKKNRQKELADFLDFVSPNAAGTNLQRLVLAIWQNHFAFLKVRVLKKPVVLV
jgi:hypothetical protein